MKHDDKRLVAEALLTAAGTLIESWNEQARAGFIPAECSDIDPAEAAACIARWLDHLPGEAWDTRLPQPSAVKRRSPQRRTAAHGAR